MLTSQKVVALPNMSQNYWSGKIIIAVAYLQYQTKTISVSLILLSSVLLTMTCTEPLSQQQSENQL